MHIPTLTLVTLSGYFILLLCIGIYAYQRASGSTQDYLLGGRKLGPAVTALSVGASDMSGWILMGLPGAVYLSGLGNIWIAIGLTVGAYFNYIWVAPKLRVMTEALNNAITLPDFFAQRFPSHANSLKLLSALVIIVFFTVYTASGIVAGGKLAESAFNMPYTTGIIATVGIILIYTLLGGFLAVSLTDFVQGCIMLATFIILPLVALNAAGGVSTTLNVLENNTQHLTTWQSIAPIALLSSLAWGLGYFGQPHILVRFMAIESVEKLSSARRIGISWMILSLLGTMVIGLTGVVVLKQQSIALNDPETIVIVLSQLLLTPAIAGVCLAAILAAIMSTISSQLLVTASALSEDIMVSFSRTAISPKSAVTLSRIGVVIVAVIATWIATDRTSGVLDLVQNAWAGFGAAFGPMILLSLYLRSMTGLSAIIGIAVGALTVIVWEYAPLTYNGEPIASQLYSIIPGFVFSFVAIVIVSRLSVQEVRTERLQ